MTRLLQKQLSHVGAVGSSPTTGTSFTERWQRQVLHLIANQWSSSQGMQTFKSSTLRQFGRNEQRAAQHDWKSCVPQGHWRSSRHPSATEKLDIAESTPLETGRC